MNYVIKIGRVGMYGEFRKVEWFAEGLGGECIASYEERIDGVLVTLYDNGKAYPRTLPTGTPAHEICGAYAKERGYTKLKNEYADIRAYND